MRVTLAVLVCALCAGSANAGYELCTFEEDITAPIGHAMMGGGIAPAAEVVDPLYAKGVVLFGVGDPIVMTALDWCELRNDAYDFWRKTLADAAGTTPQRVMLACVHQHDAPIADFYAQRLLDAAGLPEALCVTPYVEESARNTANALRAALEKKQTVTHFGMGEGEVENLASNRRVQLADGTVHFSRGSATADAALRALPVGTHDPKLKTLSFWDGERPVAALHCYATHPMSYYGKGGISADFPGMARAHRQADHPGVFQIYFSGCSGDVTAGKNNDGTPANRPVLADRLYQGMVRAWNGTERYPMDARFSVGELKLEPRSSEGFTIEDMQRILADGSATTFNRILAAMGLSYRRRFDAGQPIDVPVLDLGKARFVLMPAESFVGYQLMAQEMAPDLFVMVAGYGECAPGYIPTASATADGFNDAHTWLWVAPDIEGAMRGALQAALGVEQKAAGE